MKKTTVMRAIRIAYGITLKELADTAHVSAPYVSNIEMGHIGGKNLEKAVQKMFETLIQERVIKLDQLRRSYWDNKENLLCLKTDMEHTTYGKDYTMNQDITEEIKKMQELTFEAYKLTGQIAALAEDQEIDPANLARSADKIACQFEKSTVTLRNLCEMIRPNTETGFKKPPLPSISLSGDVRITECGWLHIRLNALLPHCRFHSPAYLTDTIVRLLDKYEYRGKPLPKFNEAIMVIDEHCDIDSRVVYDQDNKGYKAVSNALKGRIVKDDDQFSLGIALISTRDKKPACNIYVIPPEEVSDFFYCKNNRVPI